MNPRTLYTAALMLLLTGCSMSQMVVRTSTPMLDGGITAMNHETDLKLAEDAMPASLKMLEGMLEKDPGNGLLHEYAAQGFYGYSYGFIEDDDPHRASALYKRGFDHAQLALRAAGLKLDVLGARQQDLETAVASLDRKALPALFWGASCLAKWIDMNRNDPAMIAQLGKAAVMMDKVLLLDDSYYYGGAHLFFGVYYGSRAPMFGGDYARSKLHFELARKITGGKLLIGDVLYAQYLARQEQDRKAFHDKLTAVIAAPEDLFPEMALVNKIAQRKAQLLLKQENEWF
jgi:hypothetical protein